jgi:hypothetical protein
MQRDRDVVRRGRGAERRACAACATSAHAWSKQPWNGTKQHTATRRCRQVRRAHIAVAIQWASLLAPPAEDLLEIAALVLAGVRAVRKLSDAGAELECSALFARSDPYLPCLAYGPEQRWPRRTCARVSVRLCIRSERRSVLSSLHRATRHCRSVCLCGLRHQNLPRLRKSSARCQLDLRQLRGALARAVGGSRLGAAAAPRP